KGEFLRGGEAAGGRQAEVGVDGAEVETAVRLRQALHRAGAEPAERGVGEDGAGGFEGADFEGRNQERGRAAARAGEVAGDGLGQAGGLGDGATAGGEAASRVDLELDVEDGAVLAEVERLGERRDARAAMRRTEPGAGVEPPQRVERLSGDVAAAAG